MAKGRKTGGRRPGSSNKVTVDLKEMIEGALSDAGGRKYLAEQATQSPAAFLALVSKLIPRDLKVSGEIRHSIEQLVLRSFQKSDSAG